LRRHSIKRGQKEDVVTIEGKNISGNPNKREGRGPPLAAWWGKEDKGGGREGRCPQTSLGRKSENKTGNVTPKKMVVAGG